MKWVILPGMDGTGLLSKRLADCVNSDDASVIAYPSGEFMSYDRIIEFIKTKLPSEPYLLIAESFSGPAALLIASENPSNLKGLVLSATFLKRPFPWFWLKIGSWIVGCLPPLKIGIKLLLLNGASDALAEAAMAAIESVNRDVLKKRVLELAKIDVRSSISSIRCPVLFLWPARDRLIPRSHYIEIASHFPAQHIKGPHFLFHSCPKQSFNAIANFEKRLTVGS